MNRVWLRPAAAGLVAMAMLAGAPDARNDAMAGETLFLSCGVTDRARFLGEEFGPAFCAALANDLAGGLGVAVSGREDGSGAAAVVEVEVIARGGARVSMTAGRRDGGGFTAAASGQTSLSSHDRELTPAAAQTLVRAIAQLLGMQDRLP